MVERICWAVLGFIHLIPFVALFAPSLVTRLYSVEANSDVFPLLHHRAALFGCVMIACIWAAFDPAVRQIAVIIAALSMLSFLVIYGLNDMPAALRTIAIADAIGLPLLAFVAWRAFGK